MDERQKGRKRCTGRGERIMWTALFFPLSFDEIVHESGYGREQIEKYHRYTTSLHLSSYAENYWKAYATTPISLSITRSPTFTEWHYI